MLQNLHVKNLALIDEIEVEFQEGLNILTGETGAGKSIILGSVNLALGGKYQKDMIREGAEYGFVELTFSIEKEEQIQKLHRLEVYPEDGMITLSRRLMRGRSVSRINGETVPISLLKEVAEILIDIHGQHEHQSLLYKKNHLGITDAFAGDYIAEVKKDTADAYHQYKACEKELKESVSEEGERAKELSFLQFEVSEILDADLKPGEDEELETLYRRMSNGKKIADQTAEAYRYTSEGEGSASDGLSRAIRMMADAAQYDERAEELYGQLVEVDSLLNDFNRELSDYSKSLEYSEEEFYETEKRLNEINHLKTKYGSTLEEIAAYCRKQEERIRILEDYDQYVLGLKERCRKAEEKLLTSSKALSLIRKEQAKILEQAITEGLKDLNFADVRFRISFQETAGYTADGMDDVEFLISMNPGQPLRPLANVASGGELSRIMLAIKTVMADRDEVETLIFDEIDVGISGKIGVQIAKKIKILSKYLQVLIITHLPQTASIPGRYYKIEKIISRGQTSSKAMLLDGRQQVENIAQMISGMSKSENAIRSALEMQKILSDD